MNVYTFETINEGYIALVKEVLKSKDHQVVQFEGSGTGKFINKKSRRHLRNVHIMFTNPGEFTEYNVYSPERSKVMNDYMHKEKELFDNGIIDANEMGKISKVWKAIQNQDGTINANYGYMAYFLLDSACGMSQFDWCCNRMKINLYSLQCYMHMNRPKDQFIENLDQPCTLTCQYTVEQKDGKNKLNFHSNMRSNDLIYGTPYNLSFFIVLMRKMLDYLKGIGYDIELGSLFHNTVSLHIYENKIEIAESIVGLVV